MQPKPADVAVVIPVLNERENLEVLLPSLSDVLNGLVLTAEVILADGGSTDGSQEAGHRLGARVVTQLERGYGGGLRAGFSATTAPYIVTMDADLSHLPVFIEDFWRQRDEAEMLIASRYVEGGKADMGISRRVLSRILNFTYSKVLAVPLRDLSSGFRMYQRNALSGLELQGSDFDILEEILVKVYIRGGRIKEVPFHYQARNSGRSHAKLIKFGWSLGKTLFRMRRLRNSTTQK